MMTAPVLIVDDNSYALKELVDVMKYIGIRNIKKAKNAEEALTMMKKRDYGCVISALEMDDKDGLSLLKEAREKEEYFDVPFFLTDTAFTKLKVIKAGKSGVTGLIVVPYDHTNLKSKMTSIENTEPEPLIVEAKQTLEEGLNLLKKKDFSQALEVFDKLTNQGESAEVYYNIGYIKSAKGEYAEAIAAFRKATQLDRLFAKAFEAMGRAYQKMGKKEDAEKYLQQAANIYMTSEKDQDAEFLLKEIQEINQDSVNVFNSLGVLFRKRGDYKASLNHYQKALKVHPNQAHIHYNIGRVYLDMKDPVKAKESFLMALKIDPTFKEASEVLNAIELGTL